MANILVVDDVRSNRELLVTLLGYGGHQLFEACDGAEALTQTREIEPDLVIADILMPTMDGYEFVHQMRSDPAIAETKVVFYTAHYLEREARDLALQCGVQYVLTKPTEPEVILETVAAALAGTPPAAKAGPPVTRDFDSEHLHLVCDTLARKVEELEAVNRRLAALVETSERLASERDELRMLEGVVRSARAVVGARHALLAIRKRGESDWRHLVTSGMPADKAASLALRPAEEGLLSTLLRREVSLRRSGNELHGVDVGLPAGAPPFTSLLGVRVSSLNFSYGWLCLTGKLGAAEFSETDAQHAQIIGSLAGRVFENGSLYHEARDAADALSVQNAELEWRVEERTAQLDAALRELEAFSYSVSHDLRAPLRQIEGCSSILREDHSGQLDPSGLKFLERIQTASARMRHLIEDLLGLARVTRYAMSPSLVSLSALAEAVLGELRDNAPQRRVTVRVAPGLSAVGDPHLLRIALDNLLGNAWKYSSKRAEAVIEFGAETRNGETVYFVRDNGAGFDPAHVGRLFVAFQRLHSEAEFEGTGIGLATVHRIITRHGGRVWAASVPREGATFHFTLGRPGAEGEGAK